MSVLQVVFSTIYIVNGKELTHLRECESFMVQMDMYDSDQQSDLLLTGKY